MDGRCADPPTAVEPLPRTVGDDRGDTVTPPDIFISYNREDQAVARRDADAFVAEELSGSVYC